MQRIEAYFAAAVRSVFDSYFEGLGAWSVESGNPQVVQYHSDRWFAEALYLPEDGPRFSPRVEIGVLPELFVDPRRNRVDVMHTVPTTCDLRTYNASWVYSDIDGAISAFTKVRDRILRVYSEAYLKDTTLLANLIEVRCREVDKQWQEEIDRHNDAVARQTAESAFRAGDYRTFVESMSRIPGDRWSPLERRRIDFSTRKMHRSE